eukprot:7009228-Karenia_brevis.AAC.1
METAKLHAARLGWKSLWVAAKDTEAGGVSGGVAIFARQGLALWVRDTDDHELEAHRCTWAWVAGDGIPRIAIYGAYFRCGVGPSADNLETMRRICAHARAHGECFLIGADWNMSGETVAEVGFIDAIGIGGRILAGPASVGTGTTAIPPPTLIS